MIVIVRNCRFARFYVASGATTRNLGFFIPVEASSPPCHRTRQRLALTAINMGIRSGFVNWSSGDCRYFLGLAANGARALERSRQRRGCVGALGSQTNARASTFVRPLCELTEQVRKNLLNYVKLRE